MTILAPRLLRTATIALLSNALSPSSAPNLFPRSEAQRQRFRSAVLATRQSGPDCRVHRSERGFWSSYRPWTCRSPDFASPFCALSVTVNLDDRGIDHGIFHVRLIRSGVEKTHENTGFAPIAVTHEHTVPLAELLRKVGRATL